MKEARNAYKTLLREFKGKINHLKNRRREEDDIQMDVMQLGRDSGKVRILLRYPTDIRNIFF
jgi:hypothetical protein